MPKKTPKHVEEKIERMVNAWETLTPGKSYGGMTLAQFKAVAQSALDIRDQINDIEDQRTKALNDRQNADDLFLEKAQLVINGVLADPTEGPNSALYEAFGYTPKRERKTGLTRKKKKKDNGEPK